MLGPAATLCCCPVGRRSLSSSFLDIGRRLNGGSRPPSTAGAPDTLSELTSVSSGGAATDAPGPAQAGLQPPASKKRASPRSSNGSDSDASARISAVHFPSAPGAPGGCGGGSPPASSRPSCEELGPGGPAAAGASSSSSCQASPQAAEVEAKVSPFNPELLLEGAAEAASPGLLGALTKPFRRSSRVLPLLSHQHSISSSDGSSCGQDDMVTCGVCLDKAPNAEMAPCRHRMCGEWPTAVWAATATTRPGVRPLPPATAPQPTALLAVRPSRPVTPPAATPPAPQPAALLTPPPPRRSRPAADCAGDVVKRYSMATAVCPFCRSVVAGFVLVAAGDEGRGDA